MNPTYQYWCHKHQCAFVVVRPMARSHYSLAERRCSACVEDARLEVARLKANCVVKHPPPPMPVPRYWCDAHDCGFVNVFHTKGGMIKRCPGCVADAQAKALSLRAMFRQYGRPNLHARQVVTPAVFMPD